MSLAQCTCVHVKRRGNRCSSFYGYRKFIKDKKWKKKVVLTTVSGQHHDDRIFVIRQHGSSHLVWESSCYVRLIHLFRFIYILGSSVLFQEEGRGSHGCRYICISQCSYLNVPHGMWQKSWVNTRE